VTETTTPTLAPAVWKKEGAAHYLGVSTVTLLRLVRAGGGPSRADGKVHLLHEGKPGPLPPGEDHEVLDSSRTRGGWTVRPSSWDESFNLHSGTHFREIYAMTYATDVSLLARPVNTDTGEPL
jgi:hypothetical protein